SFVRTGVVHVLAISGQHLVVLAAFVWLVLRTLGTRRRHGAWIVMAVMIGYTLLTGAKPSAVRAAVMVCVWCGGIVLRRPVIPAWQNIVSPAGVVLGPPLILLTSIALIAGFLLLLIAPLGMWAGWPCALLVTWSLWGCERLVRAAEQVPGGCVYAPGPAMWWLIGFHLLLAGVVLLAGRWRLRALAALGLWLLFGLLVNSIRPDKDEMRVAFLAVGHGGCVVIEAPGGGVLHYDSDTA